MQKKVNYATTAGAMHSIISKKYKFLYFSFEVILRKWLVKETFAAIKKRVKISPLTLICRKMKLIGNMQSIFLKKQYTFFNKFEKKKMNQQIEFFVSPQAHFKLCTIQIPFFSKLEEDYLQYALFAKSKVISW